MFACDEAMIGGLTITLQRRSVVTPGDQID